MLVHEIDVLWAPTLAGMVAEAMTRQDGATLGYNPTRWSYAADNAPCGKTDGMGHAMRRPHHHYPVPAFNALASV
jgi:hypothetical protein